MARWVARQVALASLSLMSLVGALAAARADVMPHEVAACIDQPVGASCPADGDSGTCQKSTCTRRDYAATGGPPGKIVTYACMKCIADKPARPEPADRPAPPPEPAPTELAKPPPASDPAKPADPVKPADPAKPADPVKPSDPAKPSAATPPQTTKRSGCAAGNSTAVGSLALGAAALLIARRRRRT